jgi:hypothetical protein
MSDDRMASISCDEDQTIGFMLDDGAAPGTSAERVALFCELARHEWDLIVDPAKLSPDSGESSPYAWADEETLIPAREGDEIDSRWFVFTDLDEATADA